jgi:nucleotide-binding universal stress UspA family protein
MKMEAVMNAIVVDTNRPQTFAPHQDRPRSAKSGLKVLAAVDGSERTGRVLKYLLDLRASDGPFEVVLLNIQPKPQDWRLHGYGWFQREAIHDRLVNELGGRVVASASRHLDTAGIAHTARIELGDPAEIIARCAQEENCDLVLVPEPAPGFVRRWLLTSAGLSFRSVAGTTVQLVRAPVLAVS